MTSAEKMSALLHSRTNQFKRRIDEANRIVEAALPLCKKHEWYCCFSAGKDSTVTADIIPHEIPLMFSDEGYWLPETEEYLHLLQKTRDVKWIRVNEYHAYWFSVEDGDYNGIMDYPRQQGWCGCFLGLRKKENKRRRVYLSTYGHTFFSKSKQRWQSSPLAEWSHWDVWAYIISKELRYNLVYDKLANLGIPIEFRRLGPFATERALQIGQISILKQGWPDQYNQFVKDHPEAARYI